MEKQKVLPNKRPLLVTAKKGGQSLSKGNPLILLLWSFLPILVYIIADSFFGFEWGLIIGVSSGILELVYTYIRNKKVEAFLIIDIAILVALGAISYISKDPLFIRLKPAIIDAILASFISISIFTPYNLIWSMMGRVTKHFAASDLKERFKQVLKPFLIILVLHLLLTIWSAIWASKMIWGFISGPGLYLLSLLIIIWVFIDARFLKKKQPVTEELYDVLDDSGRVVGKATRSKVHSNPSLLHPSVHIHIFNCKGQLLLQKRSFNKDIQPGKWDTAIGGHVLSGENLEEASKREAREELDLEISELIPFIVYKLTFDGQSELMHVYIMKDDGPFEYNKVEIDEIRFFSLEEIKNLWGEENLTPTLMIEVKQLAENTTLFAHESTPNNPPEQGSKRSRKRR